MPQLLSLLVFLLALPLITQNSSAQTKEDLSTKLSGRILLQTEGNGESWYLNPDNNKRIFLNRPSDAFQIMKSFSLGIKSETLDTYLENNEFPENLSGKILLDVERNGEAYYINPVDLQGHYLNRPGDAFNIMRNLALGISNDDLETIAVEDGELKEGNDTRKVKDENNQDKFNKENKTIEVNTLELEGRSNFSRIMKIKGETNTSEGIKERGIIWDYSVFPLSEFKMNPDINNKAGKVISSSIDNNRFSSNIIGLVPGAHTFFRAYVIDSSDNIIYGDTKYLKLPFLPVSQTPILDLSFDANGGSGSMSAQSITSGDSQNLTANSFTRTGYTFDGWNTKADGSGTDYVDEANYTIGSDDVTLYAQWDANNYDLIFEDYDGSELQNTTYEYNADLSSHTNPSDPVRTGYTFAGWDIAVPATMPAENLVITATYTINSYTLTYDGNGQDSGSVPTDSSSPYDYNSEVTVLGNTGSLTKTDYIFTGWNTASDGSGTSYVTDDTFNMPIGDITLYAQWTLDCGDSSVTFNYNGLTVTYGVVGNESTNECWLDRNLGATQVATASDDSAAYGDLFQWGRLDDGHQMRNSGTTYDKSSSDVPGHGDFILSSSPYDWRDPQNDDLWQGVSGINNPCPAGFRIPTQTEWEAEGLSWGVTGFGEADYNELAYKSPLKLTAAGLRHEFSGSIGYEGESGYYWSSTVDSSNSHQFSFYVDQITSSSAYRAKGSSVRCIKD